MDQLLEFLDRVWKSSWGWMKVNHPPFSVMAALIFVLWILPMARGLKEWDRNRKVWKFCRRFPGNSVAMPPALASSALCFAASICRDRTLFQAQLLVACASSIYLAYSFLQLSRGFERSIQKGRKLIDKLKSPSPEIESINAICRRKRRQCEAWMWIMAGMALLYNPAFPLHFARNEWVWVDVLAGVVFLLSLGLSGGFYPLSRESETSGADAPSCK